MNFLDLKKLSEIGNQILNEVAPPPVSMAQYEVKYEVPEASVLNDHSYEAQPEVDDGFTEEAFDLQAPPVIQPQALYETADKGTKDSEPFVSSNIGTTPDSELVMLESRNAQLSTDLRDLKKLHSEFKYDLKTIFGRMLSGSSIDGSLLVPEEFQGEISQIARLVSAGRERPTVNSDDELERSKKEVERLRRHLVESESNHTQELLELQAQLDHVQGQYEAASGRILAYEQMVNERATVTKSQYDELVSSFERLKDELQEAKDDYEDQRRRNDSLAQVLSEYEIAKQGEIDLVTGSLKSQVGKLQLQVDQYKKNHLEHDAIFKELGMDLEELKVLKKAHEEKDKLIASLQKQVGNLSMALSTSSFYTSPSAVLNFPGSPYSSTDDVSKSPSQTIDPRILSNLLQQYFTSKDPQRLEILVLITKVLNMSDSERDVIGLIRDERGKWTRKKSRKASEDLSQNASLAEQWMSFLLSEARKAEKNENAESETEQEE